MITIEYQKHITLHSSLLILLSQFFTLNPSFCNLTVGNLTHEENRKWKFKFECFQKTIKNSKMIFTTRNERPKPQMKKMTKDAMQQRIVE